MIDKLRPALIAVVVTVLVLLPFSPGWAQSQINYAWDPAATVGGVWSFGPRAVPDQDYLRGTGDFENWPSGTSAAPDQWTLSGAGATIARDGTNFKIGTYSVALTRVGANCDLRLDAGPWVGGTGYYRSRVFTLGAWVRATVASRARLTINDGPAAVSSSYHTGGSTWEWLTVTITAAAAATRILAQLDVLTGDTTAQFDGVVLVEGTTITETSDNLFARLQRNQAPAGTITLSSGSRTPDLVMPSSGNLTKQTLNHNGGLRFNGTHSFLTSALQTGKAQTDTLNALVTTSQRDFTTYVEVGDEAVDTTNSDKCLVTAVAAAELTLDGDCFSLGTEAFRIQSGGLSPTTAITIEATIKPESVSSSRYIVNKTSAFSLWLNAGVLTFSIVDAATTRTVTGPTLCANCVYDVAGTYDGTTLRLYVNGAQVATTAYTGDIDNPVGQVFVGASSDLANVFQGIIDDVRLTGSAESQAVIRARHMKRQGRHWYVTR